MLADKINVSTVELFQQTGWLNLSDDEKTVVPFRELISRNKLFSRLIVKLLSSNFMPCAQNTLKQLLETVIPILESKRE
jgi:hypothetical protein